jgi:hypothetical protein
MRARAGVLAGVLVGALAASCGDGATTSSGGSSGSGGAGGCPNDLPASCPVPEPSFSADVEPIFQSHCVPCHSPGGAVPDKPFTTYAGISKLKTNVLTQVYACKMPPSTAPQLDEQQRAELLAWLVCGAKDN